MCPPDWKQNDSLGQSNHVSDFPPCKTGCLALGGSVEKVWVPNEEATGEN